MILFGELQQARAAIGPGLAEIDAAHDPVDLERGVELVVAPRVLDKTHHARREGARAVGVDGRYGESPPRGAAIVAAVDADGRGAGKHAVRIARVDEEGPDLPAAIGEGGPAEGGAAVAAAPHAVVGSGEHDLRVLRMDEDGEGLDGAQHMLPVATRRRAAEDADAALVVGLSEIASHTDIDVRLIPSGIHGFPPIALCLVWR